MATVEPAAELAAVEVSVAAVEEVEDSAAVVEAAGDSVVAAPSVVATEAAEVDSVVQVAHNGAADLAAVCPRMVLQQERSELIRPWGPTDAKPLLLVVARLREAQVDPPAESVCDPAQVREERAVRTVGSAFYLAQAREAQVDQLAESVCDPAQVREERAVREVGLAFCLAQAREAWGDPPAELACDPAQAGGAGGPEAYDARQRFGTYYTPSGQLAAQGAAVRSDAVAHPAYTPDVFRKYPDAWVPQNIVTTSLYTHPGYSNLAVGLGLNAQPVPYDYGGNIVVQPDAVYVNGDAVGTAENYASQASQLAAAGQTAELPANTKWLPLGVFAVVEGDQTNSDDVFELAVNQQGVIRGNYHNLRNNDVKQISGAVEKSTQREAWTIRGAKTPVYEAGVANLTKDQTPLLVHVGPGQSRQVSLIRLPQPQQ